MSYPSRQYRSYEEFAREELMRPDRFVQTLDEFHHQAADEDPVVDLWDRVDEEEDEDDDE